MKLATHIIFALGLATLVAYHANVDLFYTISTWGIISIQHMLIDKLSHEFRGRYRTPLFHSVIGVSILSIAMASLLIALFPGIDRYLIISFITLLLISGWSHLALDAINPGGIYVLGKRVRLAKIRYDDPIINFIFQTLGLVLVIYALYGYFNLKSPP